MSLKVPCNLKKLLGYFRKKKKMMLYLKREKNASFIYFACAANLGGARRLLLPSLFVYSGAAPRRSGKFFVVSPSNEKLRIHREPFPPFAHISLPGFPPIFSLCSLLLPLFLTRSCIIIVIIIYRLFLYGVFLYLRNRRRTSVYSRLLIS